MLIKGGHVIDPFNGIDRLMDVAVKEGKIARVDSSIPEQSAKKVVNAKGLYVTPGLIDMHVHVFSGNDLGAYIADGQTSVPPDGFTFRTGVTTVVDAGSSGWRNFRQFKEQTIDRSQTRVLALLNIVGTGMLGRFEEQDASDMNPVMTANMISAEEAKSIGLVNHVVPTREELTQLSETIMKKILANGPIAVANVIKTVNAGFAFESNGYETEAENFGACVNTKDFREGAAAFVEKRKPVFKGE